MQKKTNILLESTICCPACGVQVRKVMPQHACLWSYVCEACHVHLTPKIGDCCVFCSYADVPCPPRQKDTR